MVLFESFNNAAAPVVLCLQQLIQHMTAVTDNKRFRTRGRPRIKIEEEQIIFLVDTNFRIKDIASMFGCSRRTIERRLLEFGISNNFTSLTDEDLDDIIQTILCVHPQCGEKTITGRLRSQGIKIQRERIRNSMRRVDPSGVESRSRNVLHRRVYRVAAPNSLWHCDGYHKLIRWKMVVHGGVDGYSRLIMYLRVSSNNRASTVLSAFNLAVDEYGLPSRIRIDRGRENTLISQFLLEHPNRGPNRSSVLAGRSVHNQRIERLWRDLYSGCICFFYNFFYFLEDINLLDINSQVDLYALHFVFLPVIQTQLDIFREGWANHSLRTESNRTPLQLWLLGLSQMNGMNPDCMEVTGINEVH